MEEVTKRVKDSGNAVYNFYCSIHRLLKIQNIYMSYPWVVSKKLKVSQTVLNLISPTFYPELF